MSVEKDQAPDEPIEPQDKPEPKTFNQDAREAVEAAYEAYKTDVVAEQATPPEEPAPVVEQPEPDKGMDVAATEQVPEQPPITDAWTPEFRDHKTAEESYRHARLKMQEALEEAARLKRQFNELQAARPEPAPQREEPPMPPPPPLDKDAIEAEFFRDPVGFQLAMNEAMARHAVEQAEAKISAKERERRVQSIQASMTQKLNEHFDTSYPELKAVEPLVLEYGEQVRNDQTFMEPLLDTIKSAPPQQKARRIFEVSKAVMDESVKRLRTRRHEIGRAFGFVEPNQPQTQRLTSGAPTVVPGGSTPGVTVRTDAPVTDTPESYMKERLRMQERTMSGASRWQR